MGGSTGTTEGQSEWDHWSVAYLLILLCVLKSVESLLLLYTQVDAGMAGPTRQDTQWVPHHDRLVAALLNYLYRQLD